MLHYKNHNHCWTLQQGRSDTFGNLVLVYETATDKDTGISCLLDVGVITQDHDNWIEILKCFMESKVHPSQGEFNRLLTNMYLNTTPVVKVDRKFVSVTSNTIT